MDIKIRCNDEDTTEYIRALQVIAGMKGTLLTVLSIEPTPIDMPEPVLPKKRGRKPGQATVQYRALVGNDVLTAIGEHTMTGIVLKHLINHGPCTEKQVRESLALKRKATESEIHRLKVMTAIRPEPIGTKLPTITVLTPQGACPVINTEAK